MRERRVLLVVKEITEYNVWPVSVVVCVWEGGGRSIGGWCHSRGLEE